MPQKTCFVIMPIGSQSYAGTEITADELKERYDDLIREALRSGHPELDIVRADEISLPGTITTDILTRIMRSDFVVADVSYPNPNVFYELGLRHACRPGTVIIRDTKSPKPPFDIAHLRHIEYENTATGLKKLAADFRQYFTMTDANPERPDNQFLEVAKLTEYRFPDYGAKNDAATPEMEFMMTILGNPDILTLLTSAAGQGKKVDPAEFLRVVATKPEVLRQIIGMLGRSGQLDSMFAPKTIQTPQPRRANKRKR